MKLAIKTNNGWLSLQPDGSIGFRDGSTNPGPYETFELVPLGVTPPVPPVPPMVSFDVPKGTDFSNFQETENFIKQAKILAYGGYDTQTIEYWEGKKQEMLDRGVELEMTPSERYYWERMIGRGCGVESVALFGPYKGLIDFNESLSEDS